uniref:Dynactin subunit 1 n=1 Tax=Panagrellus redivivus TaxID=6233 RepID=A0A7E4W2Q7_PANRE
MAFAIGDHIDTDKGPGEVVFVGEPDFAEGVYVGVILQQPNGKNNGTVRERTYFECPENHGIFYKLTRLMEITAAINAAKKSSKLPTRSSAVNLNRSAGSSKTSPSLTPSESRESLSSRSRQSSFYGKPPGAPTPANGNTKQKRPGPSPKATPEPEPVKESIPKADENVKPALPPAETTAASSAPFNSVASNEADINTLRSERDALKEMLNTVKSKRHDDFQKLKQFEEMQVKISRLESHKDQILKEHSELKKQFQEAKKEIIDLKANAAATVNHAPPTDAEELLESLAMDKEMLEEKTEQLENEVQALRQKIQDLEGSFNGNGNAPTVNGHRESDKAEGKSAEPSSERVKMLEQAVERFRDIIFNYDDQTKELTAENQQLREQLDHFQNLYESMKAEVDERDKSISTLQDQIDAALGADKVIEDLTIKILDYEEKARESEQLASDYEITTRLFDELTDHFDHLKKMHAGEIAVYEEALLLVKHEADRRKDLLTESESLVIQFQRKIAEINEQLQEKEDQILRLQENLVSNDGNAGGGFAALNGSKAFADTVTSEVAQLELKYAKESVKYLSTFLPDNFFKAGSDSDLLHVHLSFPRIAAKSVLLRKLLHLKYPDVPGGVRREHVTKSHRAEQWASVERFEYALAALYTIVMKLNSITQGSTVERMSKLALQKHDIAQQEKQLDNYFELLRNNNLDENTSTDCIDRATLFFTTCAFHLSTDTYDTTEFMQNTINQFRTGFKWLQMDLKRLELALMPSELENGDFVGVLTKFSELVTDADRHAIHVSNGLLTDTKYTCVINSELSDHLQTALSALDKANRALYKTCAIVASKLSLSVESEGLLTSQMYEVFQNAVEQDYSGANAQDPSVPIADGLQNVCAFFTLLSKNLDSGQLKVPKPEAATTSFPPILTRAQVRKEDAAEAESMRWEIKKKDTQIENLNKVVKGQINDLSTMRVRLEMTTQKVLASSDEAAAAKMEARLNEITVAHRAAIQEYIDLVQAREQEISELREKLESGKARDQFDSMQQLMNTLASAGNTSSIGTNDLTTLNKRNAALLMNLHKQKNDELLKVVQSLPPIRVAPANVGMYHKKTRNPQNDIKLMLRQAHDLGNAMNVALVEKNVLYRGPCEKLNAINHQVDQLYTQFRGVIATIKTN